MKKPQKPLTPEDVLLHMMNVALCRIDWDGYQALCPRVCEDELDMLDPLFGHCKHPEDVINAYAQRWMDMPIMEVLRYVDEQRELEKNREANDRQIIFGKRDLNLPPLRDPGMLDAADIALRGFRLKRKEMD